MRTTSRSKGGITAGAMLEREGRWGDGPYLHEASGGTLKLRAYPLSSAGRAKAFGFPFIASMISGEQLPAQNQGYWETRLRINRLGDGMHLGVWLLGDEHEWPPEIDILEVVGLDPALFHANTHVREGKAPSITGYRAPNGPRGWHIFGFEWTDDRMRWTVNGKTVREHENLYGDVRLYFLVSWEIGGKWPGMPTGNTPWPGEVEIDYVRLYEKVPAGQAVTSSRAPAEPTPTPPTPSEAAPEPVSTTKTPPPAPADAPKPAAAPKPVAAPKPAATPQPASDPEPIAAPQPATEPRQDPEPKPATAEKPKPEPIQVAEPEPTPEPKEAAEPEQTLKPKPPANSSAGVVATPVAPQPPPATVAPQPAVPPQWRQAWQLDMQRRLSFAFPQIPKPSAAPSTQPAPAQVMPRSLADWRAMRDRPGCSASPTSHGTWAA